MPRAECLAGPAPGQEVGEVNGTNGRASSTVPIALVRLKGSTALYRSILEDCLPDVDRMRETGAELALAIDQMLSPEVTASVARLQRLIAELLGEAECPGCDRRGLGIQQQPDGALVCTRCRRVVAPDEPA